MHKPHIDRMKALMAAQRRKSVLLFNDRNNEMDKSNSFPAAASRAVMGGNSSAPWYKFIKGKNQGGQLWILDDIGENFGDGSTTVASFAHELNSLNGGNLTVNISSNGGDYFVGMAIYNLIKNYPGKTESLILSVAASIASIVAMAADTIRFVQGGFYAVHNAWTFACGDAKKLQKTANDLTLLNEQIIEIYLNRAKPGVLNLATLQEWLDADPTWISAEKALEIGWADEIETGYKVAAYFTGKARFKNLKHLPPELAAAHSAGQDHELWLKRKQLDLF